MSSEAKFAPARGDATREALITAATQVFARDGYHAVSLREIATLAKVNQALVGYHFRNKEGLYLVVFEHIVSQIREHIGPIADEIEMEMNNADASNNLQSDRDRYLALLLRLTDGLVSLMAQERSAPWSQLILREQQAPTAAFSLLYNNFMGRVLGLMTQLVSRLGGDNAGFDARLQVITILGQVLVFRSARAAVLRHMDWTEIDKDEVLAIQAQIRRNLIATCMGGE